MTEVKVTQEDIRAALNHLGWDDYDEFCEWALSNNEMDRFDDLCRAFARHRTDALEASREKLEKLDAECERAWKAYHIAHDQAMANGQAAANARDELAKTRPAPIQPEGLVHDEIKAAFRAGAEDMLREWGEVCECAPLPQHSGIGETSHTYWNDNSERILAALSALPSVVGDDVVELAERLHDLARQEAPFGYDMSRLAQRLAAQAADFLSAMPSPAHVSRDEP